MADPGTPPAEPVTTNHPMWGCAWPGCDDHPMRGGGPIFRINPQGVPFIGLCGEHRHLAEYVLEAEGTPFRPDDLSPMTPEQVAEVRAQRRG